MLKVIFISSFLLLAFISCNKGDITQPYDYERDTPEWLKENIQGKYDVPQQYNFFELDCTYGLKCICFENEADAVAFALRWL